MLHSDTREWFQGIARNIPELRCIGDALSNFVESKSVQRFRPIIVQNSLSNINLASEIGKKSLPILHSNWPPRPRTEPARMSSLVFAFSASKMSIGLSVGSVYFSPSRTNVVSKVIATIISFNSSRTTVSHLSGHADSRHHQLTPTCSHPPRIGLVCHLARHVWRTALPKRATWKTDRAGSGGARGCQHPHWASDNLALVSFDSGRLPAQRTRWAPAAGC